MVFVDHLDNSVGVQVKLLRQRGNNLLKIIANTLAAVPSQERCARFE